MNGKLKTENVVFVSHRSTDGNSAMQTEVTVSQMMLMMKVIDCTYQKNFICVLPAN